ncbi:DNA repair protein RecO [Gilvimarinus agarilyticus]|uniref:DNA repair protein RecO n=1 Tax=Gilvimarinus sp. 2_MG-2023 TaxID=3062666 RepID=UPI001C0901D0|nr:DNA repair protein RecO [Gilvimarinus sp. 2_MG-2023]MBU2885042.1 DNA repair protein RecO [Gilvimarinus agarilyticus]MDO6569939.1 DNA repair protein RecO [Gilvimarinus sp. 2_MG-2023]
MQHIEFEPAYVIHTRPYRDTSLIVTFFSRHYGVVAGVARGQRKASKKHNKTPMLPFTPLLINLQGKSSLKLISHFEWAGNTKTLQGYALYSGLYLNELLVRLLPEWYAHSSLYDDYQWALGALSEGGDIEVILRQLEGRLLDSLGVNISWHTQAGSEEPIRTDLHYRLDTQAGFVPLFNASEAGALSGEDILQVAAGNWRHEPARRLAKYTHRQLLQPLLGAKPLQSRQLFQ